MPVSKSGIMARDKYNSKVYDDLRVRVPKGHKDIIQAHASARGESLNGFINRCIAEAVERDTKALVVKLRKRISAKGMFLLESDNLFSVVKGINRDIVIKDGLTLEGIAAYIDTL